MANILIVEDEKNMQSIIAEYMQRGGHTCFTADDGVDALMILKNNPMDLMILDVMMPHLDGLQDGKGNEQSPYYHADCEKRGRR